MTRLLACPLGQKDTWEPAVSPAIHWEGSNPFEEKQLMIENITCFPSPADRWTGAIQDTKDSNRSQTWNRDGQSCSGVPFCPCWCTEDWHRDTIYQSHDPQVRKGRKECAETKGST